uniref:Uncharacterized protein n=1 Tax=Anguilla anguilla TaxID=7936 RepID=A0A0E9RER6_ANGAN
MQQFNHYLVLPRKQENPRRGRVR